MFEAFRVGPVVTDVGTFSLYVGCSPAGTVSAIAPDDRSGLAELRKQAPAGIVSCEPALAKAGAALGYRSAVLSAEAKEARATFATMLMLGKTAEPRIIQQIPQTIEVAQRFLAAGPWQLVRPDVPIEVTIVLGGRERRLVASVLGADGIEHGIALHESAEALARFVAAAEANRLDDLPRQPIWSLTIDPEPAWVAETVKAAYGAALVIVPAATGPTGHRVVTADDLAMLGAAMFAVSKLGPGRLTSDVTLDMTDGSQCRATARVADGGAVSARPVPAWARRPLVMDGSVPAALLTIPVLTVTDLAAAAAGMRGLGFEVIEHPGHPTASATWPGLVLELALAPALPGGACHIIVEAIDTLVAVWRSLGVDVRLVERGDERIAHIQVPGGLDLTFGDQLPAGFRPRAKARKTAARRRAT